MSFRRIGSSCVTPGLSVLILMVFLGFGTTAAWSQATSTATVTGHVTDEQNAAVAGAEVRLLEMATGSSQTTLSNETGRYVIVNVQPGQGCASTLPSSAPLSVSTLIPVPRHSLRLFTYELLLATGLGNVPLVPSTITTTSWLESLVRINQGLAASMGIRQPLRLVARATLPTMTPITRWTIIPTSRRLRG